MKHRVLLMGEVLSFPKPELRDGGKARIQHRRAAINLSEPITADDLRMDHADRVMPCDVAYPDQPA